MSLTALLPSFHIPATSPSPSIDLVPPRVRLITRIQYSLSGVTSTDQPDHGTSFLSLRKPSAHPLGLFQAIEQGQASNDKSVLTKQVHYHGTVMMSWSRMSQRNHG